MSEINAPASFKEEAGLCETSRAGPTRLVEKYADASATRHNDCEGFIITLLSSGEFETAANEIIRLSRQRFAFTPTGRESILAALQGACREALNQFPPSYPLERIAIGFLALASLVDPVPVRKRGKRAWELIWNLANMFRSDLEILRRAKRVRSLGAVWSPPTWH